MMICKQVETVFYVIKIVIQEYFLRYRNSSINLLIVLLEIELAGLGVYIAYLQRNGIEYCIVPDYSGQPDFLLNTALAVITVAISGSMITGIGRIIDSYSDFRK